MGAKHKIFGDTKKCSSCGIDKEINENNFYIDSRAEKSGRHKYTAKCIECISAKKKIYNKTYCKKREVLDRKNETARIRYQKNPEKYKKLKLDSINKNRKSYIERRRTNNKKKVEIISNSYQNERLKSFFSTKDIDENLKETYLINLKLKRSCRTISEN